MRQLVTLLATLAASTSLALANSDAGALPPPSPTADASPPPPSRSGKWHELPFATALAVNAPFMWPDARSVGVSAYARIHPKQSLRFNFASYNYSDLSEDLFLIALGGDPGEAGHAGRITDFGVSWQYFPRRVWSGLSLEAGLLIRLQDIHWDDEMAIPAIIDTKATGFAARGLIGWSWLGWERVFLAVAVGASVGPYVGTETTAATYDEPMYVSRDFARIEVSGEAYLRLGLAFGL